MGLAPKTLAKFLFADIFGNFPDMIDLASVTLMYKDYKRVFVQITKFLRILRDKFCSLIEHPEVYGV